MAKNPRADHDWQKKILQRERVTDFAWTLAKIDWDIFTTLTFTNPVPRPESCYGMAWHWCQSLSKVCHVPYNRLLIALRGELGEEKGRFHFHVLVGGTTMRNTRTLCHTASYLWKGISGMARTDVRPYDRSLAGAEYISKCLGANDYELSKYSLADQVTLSDSVFRLLRIQESRVKRKDLFNHRLTPLLPHNVNDGVGMTGPATETAPTRLAATSAAITQNTAI